MTMERFKALTDWVGRLPRRRLIGVSIALAAVLFVSLNVFASRALDAWRADVTEARVWTLSDGSRALLSGLDEPLHMRLFLSGGLTEAAPQLAAYANRVRGTLETYADLADGKITLEVIDPAPFSDAEDRAVGFGIDRIALAGAAEPMFFGLAVTNSTDGRATIPVFSPDREAWLEYDLTRLVAELGQPVKPKVALLDGLGLAGNPMMGQPEQQSLAMLRELYDVEVLSGDVNEFPEGARVVAVVHPQGLSDATLYALDQWVMGGGALMAFVDPHAETQRGPQGAPAANPTSDLAPLFEAWGVRYDPAQAIADPQHALTTVRRINNRDAEVGNPAWLRIGPDAMERETPALARLSALILTSAGSFSADEDVELTPLVTASADARLADAGMAGDLFGDPRRLLDEGARPESAPVPIARLSGALTSAFPDGAPEGSEWAADHIAQVDGANVLLVADADMLMDRNWIQRRRILGADIPQAFANNGDFFLNAAEQMAGGAALADLRGRAIDWRPLERIDEMTRAAEAEYRATEQALLDRISEAETALRDLAPAEGEGGALFSAEAVAEAEKLRADLLAARAELRQVQYDLRSDVETLKSRVTTINVGVVPVLAALAALAFALRKPRRKPPVRATA
ncbi:GldG family protein [Pikeienuella sp. HZG-20]|uniref:GldG family protein n=1 Tax=Paludibacillus litoralis TaxID=3133267 RepID=UPI0030EE1E2A